MAFLKYRASLTPTVPTSNSLKTSGLTNEEVDGNFKSLDNSKIDILGGNMTGPLTSTSTLQSEFPILAPSTVKNGGTGFIGLDLGILNDSLTPRTISTGTSPCSVSVDPTGNWVFVVNSASNSVSVFSSLLSSDTATSTFTGITSPAAGVFHPNGRHFYVVGGSSSLTRISYTSGAWVAAATQTITDALSAYQHAIMHPSGKYIFLGTNTAAIFEVYSLNADTGAITYVGEYGSNLLSAGTNFQSGVDIDPSGRFIFVAEFTAGIAKAIQTQIVNSNGSLTGSSIYTITGSETWTVRGLKVHPSGKHLYYFIEEGSAAAAKIYHFSINSSTGALTLVKTYSDTEADFGAGYLNIGFSSTPQCVSRDGTTLYATRGANNTQINTFRIDPFTGRIGGVDAFNGAPSATQLSKVCLHPFTSRIYQIYNTSNTIRAFANNDFRSSWSYIDRLDCTFLDLKRQLNISGYTSGTITIKAPAAAGSGTIELPTGGGGTFVTTTTIGSQTAGAASSLATARTLTIGSTSKTFNGTADVSWTLSEIGAASSTSTVNLTGDQTVAGVKSFSNVIGIGGQAGSSASWTTVGWARGISFPAGYTLWWPKGSTAVAKGIGATSDNNIYFAASTADDASAVASYPFQFNMSSGNFQASGDVTAYSDIRLKTDINKISDALSKVKQLSGYTFLRTDSNQRQTGLIAQEVEKVLPEAIKNDGEYLSLAYGNMVGLLVEAIKEQQAQIEELKAALKA